MSDLPCQVFQPAPGANPFTNPIGASREDDDERATRSPPPDRWLTVAEAAARVGVSESTIRRYITRDGLTSVLGRVSEWRLLEVEGAARRRASESRFKGNPA